MVLREETRKQVAKTVGKIVHVVDGVAHIDMFYKREKQKIR
jgi:hypothetical protein